MKFIDKIPLVPLLIISIALGLAPFAPEPHIVEKLRLLSQGELTKPLDVFDLFLHGTPAVILVIKLIRMAKEKGRANH